MRENGFVRYMFLFFWPRFWPVKMAFKRHKVLVSGAPEGGQLLLFFLSHTHSFSKIFRGKAKGPVALGKLVV